MLKKIYRVTKDKEFQTIFRRGRYQSTAFFSINYLPNRQNLTRIGIVITKKITKKAVERNLIKRRVREIAREFHPRIKPGFDLVIVTKKPLLDADYTKLKKDLEYIFRRADLLK